MIEHEDEHEDEHEHEHEHEDEDENDNPPSSSSSSSSSSVLRQSLRDCIIQPSNRRGKGAGGPTLGNAPATPTNPERVAAIPPRPTQGSSCLATLG